MAVLLPAVLMGPTVGLEFLHPLAVSVLGGLVTTLFLALFVLPAVYLRVAGRPAARAFEVARPAGTRRAAGRATHPRPRGRAGLNRPGAPNARDHLGDRMRYERGRRGPSSRLLAGLLALVVAGTAGCAGGSADEETDGGANGKAATVEPVAGSDIPRVTLSDKAAERLGLTVVPVRSQASAGHHPARHPLPGRRLRHAGAGVHLRQPVAVRLHPGAADDRRGEGRHRAAGRRSCGRHSGGDDRSPGAVGRRDGVGGEDWTHDAATAGTAPGTDEHDALDRRLELEVSLHRDCHRRRTHVFRH